MKEITFIERIAAQLNDIQYKIWESKGQLILEEENEDLADVWMVAQKAYQIVFQHGHKTN